MGLSDAYFYKRTEFLFDGVLVGVRFIDIDVSPWGFIRVSGDSVVQVEGQMEGESVSEDVGKISSYRFDRVLTITPKELSFTGRVFVVDSNGVKVPTNRFLFKIPVYVNYPFLRQSAAVRTQQEPGIISVDDVIQLSVIHLGLENVEVGDLVKIDNKIFTVRNIKRVLNRWMIQAVIQDAPPI
jgi:hypothetical protein